MMVIILGREGNLPGLEFSLQFSLGRLGNDFKECECLAAFLELTNAKALRVLYEGRPTLLDCDIFASVHKLDIVVATCTIPVIIIGSIVKDVVTIIIIYATSITSKCRIVVSTAIPVI